MVVWTALKSDVAHRSSDPKEQAGSRTITWGLMTPVLKGVPDRMSGFSNASGWRSKMYGGPWLYRRERHGAVRARCAHRHDL